MLQSLILAKGDSNLRSDTVLEPDDPQALSSPCPLVAENTWHLLRAYHVANTYSSLPPLSFILSSLLDLVLAALPNLSVSRHANLGLPQDLCIYHFLSKKMFTHTQLQRRVLSLQL